MHFNQAKQGLNEVNNRKDIKQGHSRVFLSGIFNARSCSYKIGKTLLYKRPLRGRSRVTTLGDDGLCVYKRQTTRVEDPETSSGIALFNKRQTARGFTLIELLVVVLIIGILAAVALPQYQKAVYKSRYSNLKMLVHSLATAEQVYYMANDKYTGQFDDLDITLPANSFISCSYYAPDSCIICNDSRIKMRYGIDLPFSSRYPNKAHCLPLSGTNINGTLQSTICQMETGNARGRNDAFWYD